MSEVVETSAETPLLRWLRRIVVAAVIVLPLAVSPGEVSFREPKEMVMRGEALLLAALIAIFAVLGRQWRLPVQLRRRWVQITIAIVGWTAITALFAANRLIAFDSLIWVVTLAFVFCITVVVARDAPLWFVALPLIPMTINVIAVFVQERGISSIFRIASQDRNLLRTAFIGNPNDLGSYLLLGILSAATLAIVHRRKRWFFAVLAIVGVIGVMLAQTLTAMIALVVAAVSFGIARSMKTAIFTVILLFVGVIAATYAGPHIGYRYARLIDAVKNRNFDDMVSYRTTANVAAALMFADNPLLGVGPGGFKYSYFDYKTRAEAKFPSLRKSEARRWNFAEVHNDHLQVASQTGIIGYALFLLTGLYLIRTTRRIPRDVDDVRARYAATLGIPLTVAFFVLALAQFPLELASVSHTLAFYFATIIAWSGEAE